MSSFSLSPFHDFSFLSSKPYIYLPYIYTTISVYIFLHMALKTTKITINFYSIQCSKSTLGFWCSKKRENRTEKYNKQSRVFHAFSIKVSNVFFFFLFGSCHSEYYLCACLVPNLCRSFSLFMYMILLCLKIHFDRVYGFLYINTVWCIFTFFCALAVNLITKKKHTTSRVCIFYSKHKHKKAKQKKKNKTYFIRFFLESINKHKVPLAFY